MKQTFFFACLVAAFFLLAAGANSGTLVSQQPVSGGGVARSSQLWQDPGPNGNDLNGDAVCWADFSFGVPVSIDHIEWWGTGACEIGFQIEIWRQDPGTIAYQPLAVFYYGGDHTVKPETRFRVTSADFVTTAGADGIPHYSLDLAVPVQLPANDASNVRWFIGIIGLTSQAYYTWNWSQGIGGSSRTYQFVRGEGYMFRPLGEGRALVLGSQTTILPTPTETATRTVSPTPTMTATGGGTSTPTNTRSFTLTPTSTLTASLTLTETSLPTETPTPTETATYTPTKTNTLVPSDTLTFTATETPIPTLTETIAPTETPTCTTTETETPTLTITPTSTPEWAGYDFNHDSRVDAADLLMFMRYWGAGAVPR